MDEIKKLSCEDNDCNWLESTVVSCDTDGWRVIAGGANTEVTKPAKEPDVAVKKT